MHPAPPPGILAASTQDLTLSRPGSRAAAQDSDLQLNIFQYESQRLTMDRAHLDNGEAGVQAGTALCACSCKDVPETLLSCHSQKNEVGHRHNLPEQFTALTEAVACEQKCASKC